MAVFIEVPFEVQKPQHGLRVDQYLRQRLHKYSRTAVQKLIDEGQVLLRDRRVKASTIVRDGDTVVIKYPKHVEPPCAVQEFEVLYADQDLLAVDKLGGVLSHPTDKIIENAATTIVKRQFPFPLYLVHRLDRDTSGVLLFAKSSEAARIVSNQFLRHGIKKTYLAVVRGAPSWKTKRFEAAIGREGGEIKVRQTTGEGQSAATSFQVLKIGRGLALVECKPETGRLHQIRVHLAALGHPIVGDRLYTGDGALYMKTVRREITGADLTELGAARTLLHAARIELLQPTTGGKISIESPVPDDFPAF